MQLGTSGTLERHGFARNRIWIIDDEPPPMKPNGNGSKASVNLLLKPSEDDLKCWPHRYAFLMACLSFPYLMTAPYFTFQINKVSEDVKNFC
jgi:glucose-6-phosphate 1-epimerase